MLDTPLLMTFRKSIFWLHLIAGLVAGVVILIMSVTGAALAYEKEVIAWAERDVQRVDVPANAPRLAVADLLARAKSTHPEAKPTTVVIKRDPTAAVALGLGRSGNLYANPYTGAIQTPPPTFWRSFMGLMVSWHRYLALSGDNQRFGKAVTGACNTAFLVLGLTGLYLWWPRTWSARALKGIATVRFGLSGKARDWNWHNAFGLWFALPLIVLTATALPISYGWAGQLIAKLNPSTPAPPAPPAVVATPAPGAAALSTEALLESVYREVPDWKQVTLNLGGPPVGPGAPAAAPAPRSTVGPAPVSFSIRERSSWPRTATTTLALDPFTGAVLKHDTFGALPLGNQVRGWTRYLHTGEALGPIGQAVAGVASLVGAVLMWTGFALSYRRFFGGVRAQATAG